MNKKPRCALGGFRFVLLWYCSICLFHELKGQAEQPTNVKVFYEQGMYGGWPANNGMWVWGSEMLVGFSKGYHKDLGRSHNIDREKTEWNLFARSLDGGMTWSIEDPGKQGVYVPKVSFGTQRTDVGIPETRPLEEPIDFGHPDFALIARNNTYWYSYDRGKTWAGPFWLPTVDSAATLAARTDYIIDGPKTCLIFLTISSSPDNEGRVGCFRTEDGGLTWSFIAYLSEEKEDGFSIMPASVRLSPDELLVATREKEGKLTKIGVYYSGDNGNSWDKLSNAVEDTGVGNPPALTKLGDGRLCLIYGYRSDAETIQSGEKTSDIRAKISNDNGKTWSEDFIIRSDGSGRDIGYPRVVQRPDGKVVATYYFTDEQAGVERYIGATIWRPAFFETP